MSLRQMPEKGRDAQTILNDMVEFRKDDAQWKDGKVWSLVYHPGDEISQFAQKAYTLFFSENALNPSAFPSLRKMENEVVAMAAHLLGGDHQVCGNMTSGGTESILMAVKTARDWGFAHKRRLKQPNIVLPRSAHPAFEKAAHYFGLKTIYVPVAQDLRANVKAMAKAINRETVLLVGSAPSYPHGVVDPIEDLANLAQSKKILMHVDACVGGWMLPFVRDLGYPVPPFDFSVPGVTSLSVDLHKYGYMAKGTSIILYKNPEIRKHQYFCYTEWPGGIYASPTMTGTRPGGPIAAAWAMIHRLGYQGYLDMAREVMKVTVKLKKGIQSIPGIKIYGHPHMSVMAIASDGVNVYEVGDEMSLKGWSMDRQQFPPTLHLTINHTHIHSVDAFLNDLKSSVEIVRKRKLNHWFDKSSTAIIRQTMKWIPSPIRSKLTATASKFLNIGGTGLPQRTAAMYGMMAALPNRGDVKSLVIDVLDKMTRLSNDEL